MTRSKFYTLFFVTAGLAYCWVGWNVFFKPFTFDEGPTLCLIKNVTGYPCPSCGTTRAVILLCRGEWMNSFVMNPLGLPAIISLLALPLLALYDVVTKQQYLYYLFLRGEHLLRNKKIFIPAGLLIFLIWTWEIYKH